MARLSPFGRLIRHFHEHPRGRLHEIMFWAGLGIALGVFAIVGRIVGFVNLPFSLMIGIVAACLVLWSFLPQRKVAAKQLPAGRRGELARQKADNPSLKRRKPGRPGG